MNTQTNKTTQPNQIVASPIVDTRQPRGLSRGLMIAAVLVVSGLLSAFFALDKYSSDSAVLIKNAKANSERFEMVYRDSAATRLSTLRLAVNILQENNEITAAFAKDDRAALMNKVLPFYKEVLKQRFDIDQFIFWTPPAKLYLRSSDPKSFGIDASSIRPIVVAANEKRAEVSGMETGIGGVIGLRALIPIMDGLRMVGAIELGSELSTLLQRASTTANLDYAIGLDQKRAENVQLHVDAKNDSVQGTDIFYIYSSPAVGQMVRSMSFNPRNPEAQIVDAGRKTIFVRSFAITNFSGVPTVVVATMLDLTDEMAGILRTVAIQTTIFFVLAISISLLGIFKFHAMKEGFSKAVSRQRKELEERAAFCEAAAEQLKDVDLIKRGFFTNLIAAVNEPLQAVAGTLQTVFTTIEGARVAPNEKSQTAHNQLSERLRFALNETTRLSGLIGDYQQIELFRQKLVAGESALTSMSTVVTRTLTEDLVTLQRLPQLKISADVPESLPQIRADADLLRRALSALINYAARGAGHGKIALQGSVNSQGWLILSITGTAFELAGAPTESLLDESRQFLSRLANEQGATDSSTTLIPIVLARMIVEFYGGRIDTSPSDKAYPGFVIYIPAAA
jgi:hypothetical protein